MHEQSTELTEISELVDELVERGQAIKRKMERCGDSAGSQDVARYIAAVSSLQYICLERQDHHGMSQETEGGMRFLM